MSQKIVKLTVYKNRTNPVTLSLKSRLAGVETDVDFSAVTRMILTLNPNAGTPVEVDTQDHTGIDYSTNGSVVFTIGNLAQIIAMEEGEYNVRLTAIDGSANATELVNEDNPESKVVFVLRDTTAV